MPPPRGTSFLEGPGDYTTTQNVYSDTYPAIDPLKANLTGKSVFITGATRGIGREIAISFAKAGASFIAIGARADLSATTSAIQDAARAAHRPEPTILPLHLEVTSPESVSAAAHAIEQAFQHLDVVVNNAGVIGQKASIGDSDPDTWWESFNVNLRGPYLIARACLPLLLKSCLKTLITISSVGAHLINPALSAYQTSKLAVLRFTEFVAAEYAEHGVIAFAVHPGNVMTPMVESLNLDEAARAVFTETPRLCGDSLVFLVAERREWLAGRYVNVTWDLEEFVGERKRGEIVEGDLLKVRLVV